MINQSHDNYCYQATGSIENKILIFVTTPSKGGGGSVLNRLGSGALQT